MDTTGQRELLAVLNARLDAMEEKSDDNHRRIEARVESIANRTHELAREMARTQAYAEYVKRMIKVLETADPTVLASSVERLTTSILRHDRILVGPDPEKVGGLMGTTQRLESVVDGLVRTHKIAARILGILLAPPSFLAIVKLHAWFFLGKTLP